MVATRQLVSHIEYRSLHSTLHGTKLFVVNLWIVLSGVYYFHSILWLSLLCDVVFPETSRCVSKCRKRTRSRQWRRHNERNWNSWVVWLRGVMHCSHVVELTQIAIGQCTYFRLGTRSDCSHWQTARAYDTAHLLNADTSAAQDRLDSSLLHHIFIQIPVGLSAGNSRTEGVQILCPVRPQADRQH